MAESEDKGELGGLARSIDALFSGRPARRSSGDLLLNDAETGVSSSSAGGGIVVPHDAATDQDSVLDGPLVPQAARDDSTEQLAEGDALTPLESEPGESTPWSEPTARTQELPWPERKLEVGPVASAEVLWGEVREPLDASGDALEGAVDAFLSGPEGGRTEHAARIAEISASMRARSSFGPLPAAVIKLALAAGDPPREDVIAVAQSLLSPAVASRIVALLAVERDEARQAELRTVCVRVGPEMAVALSDALAENKDRFARFACVAAIAEMGAAATPVVEKMIEDPRWFVVRNAVTILGEGGGERAIELVTSTLANSDGRVRREALQALAKLGGDDAGQLAYGLLEDPDPEVRLAAAVTCGELKVERALKQLVKMLETEKKDPDFIVLVLRALGQLADPGAVNAIEKHAVPSMFSRPRTDVRIAAYRALHHIGTPRARRMLNQAADDKDREIKSIVREILGMG